MRVGAPEREAALEWARAARAARSQVRHDLSSRATELPDVLAAAGSDRFLGTVRLLWVLESLPGARKTDTRRALAQHGIDGQAPLGDLTEAECAAVLRVFAGAGGGS